ncbi:hypothetical protein PSV08DRAFT_412704 [Bipolaris maydis]|nr:hypothetical protein J3E73DRAFT_432629 [Bipolaris maydis]KAJ6266294.1 hypothetical protein PSV08DRAFT_412704 [Bipolaris maydis]KAJ6281308.1 hypothetical protein J3E71DRAFT_392455 [Bipolaris maydis]
MALDTFFHNKIEAMKLEIIQGQAKLRRLEAQRNDYNSRVRLLREELGLLQQPGSYVGEVVKVMGTKKVLVKVHPEGKYVVDVADSVDITKLTAGKRVTLLSDSYKLEKLLPSSVDPLVSLMMVEKVPDSTYDMIGGLDQQIKEIKEVIELGLQHPELFESLGIAQPKGVLLYGPPGTGKTLLARAVAHHADCKFIRVSGSELVQKYIGEGSRMVRELFVMAREHAPSIIFMDEIDSIGSSRVEGSSGGDSEVQRTMLELLNQLDGFEPTKNIKIIMATNRLDILDPALLRPGRIDRKIEFPPPTVEARADILRIHSRSMNLTRGINLTKIAEKMNGCSGAELKGVCTEAGMYALRERRVHVTQEDFDLATAKVLNKHDDKATSLSKLWKDEATPASVLEDGSLDPVYEAKAKVLNKAVQDIGMGRYQWQLFIVIGFGWAMDNLWPIVTSLIFTPVSNEFRPNRPPFLTLSQNIGLLFGAMFWGFGCDIFGRRWAFNLTIGITAVFGMVAAGSPNFAAIGTFAALWSVGVGGNLPVDSAIFLEFLPGSHQYLLTILSIHWSLAQVFATLIAWPLLGNLTCQQTEDTCTKGENMGWRYFVLVMGGTALIMFAIRFVFFTIFESPKYLMGKGEDEKAVEVVHEVAHRNGKASPLTVQDLEDCNLVAQPGVTQQQITAAAVIKRNLQKLDSSHVKALFATRRLAFSTSVITIVWAFIGLGYPLYNAFLPYIQATRGVDFGDGSTYITYRNSLIIAVLGVPGCILGGVLVETPLIGRKGTLAASTVLTGVFLLCSTTALTSDSLLGWNCAYNFMSNIMYAVLYAYTPEIFPTKDRGTGNAITASANRIFGIMAPVVAMFADLETSIPVYVSGALFIAAGLLVLVLPFESRGKASM